LSFILRLLAKHPTFCPILAGTKIYSPANKFNSWE
jgi:hypothetical protein